ncbi:Na+/H+ antiporter NhaA [Hymenobacter properus]|uniref:Na(+)/H(+) antiporter NhaA n=1 Tax=Hymenobacter properus TaxID=2791026 RepID=A0A931FLL1_9BACT|nr:Na+/H+ antiporter NhaA [Hymenobacter properus]MBF9144328.1 Na+/H+ antiporter NhaA [Hymenobacter properus]MBR7723146.1 Na+/H+ antiporter NhaA [Microvirga sp. SRT04]
MPIRRVLRPIRELSDSGKLAGLLLLLATLVSLGLSNSAAGPRYLGLWELHLGSGLLNKSVAHWINDGLMGIFFFLVGLEIKREAIVGELAEPRQALLPALAAVGGVAAPALLYLAFNHGTSGAAGWATPTATDIAFSLGILALLGRHVPAGLRIFLTALAIIDDLLAVLIIAFFYSGSLHWAYLGGAAGIFALLLVLNKLGVKTLLIYLVLGLGLWFCVLESGIHATVAGVLLALTIPLDRIEDIEHALQRPVNYLLLPLFALCNTAIVLNGGLGPVLHSPVALGIGLGLLLGKPLGIVGMVGLLVRLGVAHLPAEVSWRQMVGLGFTAGIGFTMAIFIATLAFHNPQAVDVAKLAVLLGSALAAIVGAGVLWFARADEKPAEAEATASATSEQP